MIDKCKMRRTHVYRHHKIETLMAEKIVWNSLNFVSLAVEKENENDNDDDDDIQCLNILSGFKNRVTSQLLQGLT